MYARLLLVLTACLLLATAPARAADIANLLGVWSSAEHEGITTGSRHFPHDAPGPHFVSGQFTLTITRQEGRRFTGVKASGKHEEKIMGVIGYDGTTVHILEDEGQFTGQLLPDGSLELIYSHDVGPSKAIGITRYIRKPQ